MERVVLYSNQIIELDATGSDTAVMLPRTC